MRNVVLASASPRRQTLLRTLVPEFDVLVAGVDEEALTTVDPEETARTLAAAKASAVAALRPDAIVIGGDTVVAFEDASGWRQLAKPGDAAEACAMLQALAGKTHLVITGVSIVAPGRTETFTVRTEVKFRALTEREIAEYVATGEPMDKAGAYAIQGGAAGFVTEIRGSHTNVVGLPMEALSEVLPTFLVA